MSALRLAAPCLLATAVASVTPASVAQEPRVDVPVDQRVSAHLEFLASDALGGRETGTLEGRIAAHYVASVFRSIGLEPAGADGGYLAPYELVTTRLDVDRTALTFEAEARRDGVESLGLADMAVSTGLEQFTDFVVRGYGAEGFAIDAPVTFAGHGVVDADAGVDEYAGLDVTGRFVLVFSGVPGDRADLRSAGRWRAKLDAARERGALGLAIVVDGEEESTQRLFDYLGSSSRRTSMTLASNASDDAPFPLVYITSRGAGTLAVMAGRDLERLRAKPIGEHWDGSRLTLTAPVVSETIVANNVAGVVRGSDRELAHEYVVCSAHLDHIGRNDDGSVNNGADDNASGTTTLLTVAELLAANPPRRSVLCLAVSGEEKGLLGSRAWVDAPTVPLDAIVANINTDMVGRNTPGLIGATPSPEHDGYNTMVEKAVALAPESGLEVRWAVGLDRYQRRVDVYYHRSDHANFADAGIPVVFFFAGEHEDYHRASDTPEKIDLDKVARMARFVTRLATEVANDPEPPVLIDGES